MKWKELGENAEGLLVLDKDTLRNLEPAKYLLDSNIKNWLKSGKLVALKKGLYTTRKKWEKERNKNLYLEYLANKLLEPSYLSLGYVLSGYQLLTEAQMAITSVTVKTGRSFNNKLGAFSYYNIKEELFTGYRTKKYKTARINIATKEKALFDYLYFQFYNKKPNKKSLENLRINWSNLTKKELKDCRKFTRLVNNPNIEEVFKLIVC